MSFVARVVALFAIGFLFSTAAAWAAEHAEGGWPKPVGRDIEGGFLDRLTPFGYLGVEYDVSDSEVDGVETDHTGVLRGELGARLQLTDQLWANGAVRTGEDFRSARIVFGDGNFDQNFDFSVSELNFRLVPDDVPVVRRLGLTVGRQPSLHQLNPIYGQTVLDEDLRLDGAQLDWDCGCDEWDVESETSVGIFALNRFDEGVFANNDKVDPNTANLFIASSGTTWKPIDTFRLHSYLNYYRYGNAGDGFQDFEREQAGITDTPSIIHAGLDTTIEIAGIPVTIGGEYINNLDADKEEDAFTAGIRFDLSACDRLHPVSYLYQSVNAWSIVPGLAQDDHRSLRTGYDAHVVQATFNTTDHLSFDLEALIAESDIDGVDDDQEWRVRLGLNYTFD